MRCRRHARLCGAPCNFTMFRIEGWRSIRHYKREVGLVAENAWNGRSNARAVCEDGDRVAKTDRRQWDAPFRRSGSHKATLGELSPGTGVQIAPFPLPMQIADYLRDLIIHDQLRPGERIREQFVADRLQVSRTPTREALMILAMEGLVNIDPNRGAHVACYDDKELADIRKIQATLEGLACVIIAQRRKDISLKGVSQQFSRMNKAIKKENREELFKSTQRFYYEIILSTGKNTLLEIYEKIYTILYRSRYIKAVEGTISSSALLPHKEIMEALETHDPALARSLILRHRSEAA